MTKNQQTMLSALQMTTRIYIPTIAILAIYLFISYLTSPTHAVQDHNIPVRFRELTSYVTKIQVCLFILLMLVVILQIATNAIIQAMKSE